MNIKILGTGCPKCRTLEKLTSEIVAENNFDAEITRVEDIVEIRNYGVMEIPGLVVNERVLISGEVPSKDEIKKLIEKHIKAKKIEFSQDILEIAKFAKAMSHPVRVFILKKLSQMDTCCYSSNLVEELPVGRSALSQHLKELKFAGLIQGEIESPYIKYCINRENFEKAKILYQNFFGMGIKNNTNK